MSDSIPSCCPKRPLPLLFTLALLLLSFSPAFANNDPHLPHSVSAQILQLREFIAGYAQNFVGIEYRHGGTSTATGFDCSGFTSFALSEFGVKVSSCSSTQSTQGEEVSLDAVLPGDLVFFGRRGRVTHVALVVNRTEEGIFCVHSTCSKGIMVENTSTSKYWKPKIMFARDVITGQALEKCLLPLPSQIEVPVVMPPLPVSEELSPECEEEYVETCASVAPMAMLKLPDLPQEILGGHLLAGK